MEVSPAAVANLAEQRRWNDPTMWNRDGHEWSAHFGGTDRVWNDFIFPSVKPFRGRRVLEIAPGHGRVTQYLAVLAARLVVVDLNPACIAATRELLGQHVAEYIVNDGLTLPVPDDSQDLIVSFDAFVHMHRDVVASYLREIRRTLVPGGCGFIHHANLLGGEELSFKNIAGRANMTPELFESMVEGEGMRALTQRPVSFSELVDCLTLFRKLS